MKRDERSLKWAKVNGYKYVTCDDEGNIKGYGFSRQTLENWNKEGLTVLTIRQYEKATKEDLIMFRKDEKDRYYEGLSRGQAEAYVRIHDLIKNHENDEPKAVLCAIKMICEFELQSNPYSNDIILFKTKEDKQ